MSANTLQNNKQSDDYEERLRVSKLQPVGREILRAWKRERIDEKTIILKRPEKWKKKKN